MNSINGSPQNVNIEIEYDPSVREYRWIDPSTGAIFPAQPGPKNKAKLWRFALGMLDPELYTNTERMIAKNPQLERVAWRGAQIVAESGVEIFPGMLPGNVWAKVDSSDGYGRYSISSDGGYDVCECEHYQMQDAPLTHSGRRICKHIAAARLHLVTREDRF